MSNEQTVHDVTEQYVCWANNAPEGCHPGKLRRTWRPLH